MSVAFAITTIASAQANDAGKQLSLNDIFASGAFYPRFADELRSMNDGEHYTLLERDGEDYCLNQYDFKNMRKIKTIVKESQLINPLNNKNYQIDDYSFSPNEKMLLIASETDYIYRHSTASRYFIYDIATQKSTPLSENGKQRLATFSPDGKSIAFVRENNIFIKNLETLKELQITEDGKINTIINGATDWVYEEEFGFTQAFAWSPDSKYIAYYKFDESEVKQFNMTIYDSLYPQWYEYKYPKAGEDNSIVSIHVYDMISGKTFTSDIGTETDQYIPRIKWSKIAENIAIYRLNRLQNKLEIILSNPIKNTSKIIYSEENKYYIDINDNFLFLDDNESFILTSEKNGYNHFYLCNMNTLKQTPITSGNWDVAELAGYNDKTKTLYYISSEESPINRALFSIQIDGKQKAKLSQHVGTNEAVFSNGMKYFVNTYSNANSPLYISIHDSKGKEIHVLQDNKELKERMKEYGFTKKVFKKMTTEDGIELNYWIMKPVNFDSTKQYPLLMFVYGGPGSQTVLNSWDYSNYTWFQYLTQNGYIVASVDNRGTGARGEEFKKCTYLQLGKLETQDQIAAAKYFGSSDYINKDKIGIFGWSYGGYMSTLCMTKGADVFSTGVAVAPVTNWRYYDNIYTERYMRKPQDNANGYDDNSPINHIEKLKGAFLLVHGTADDNVHLQNSIELTKKLISQNIDFDMMFYPNKNHGIYGGYTRLHLFTKITKHLNENLK